MPVIHDVLMPQGLSEGARMVPQTKSVVVTTSSGRDEVIGLWGGIRRKWDVSKLLEDDEAREALLGFWEARDGRVYGFRFRDPFDHLCRSGYSPDGSIAHTGIEPLGTGNGAQTRFPVVKTRGDAARAVVRRILRPVGALSKAYVDGVALAAGTYEFDEEAGELVLDVAAASGKVVGWSGVFDTPARFETDAPTFGFDYPLAVRMTGVTIIELLEGEVVVPT
ncbi:MAG: DUF2460 domain-containing protein [Fimbriimonas sp.]